MKGKMIDQNMNFYRCAIAPMIHSEFPEYENRISVGVCGDGSDCFGYEDDISKDHDFGIGVSLWVTAEDAKQISSELQTSYLRELEIWNRNEDPGYESPDNLKFRLASRRGVQTIQDFYNSILGFNISEDNPEIDSSQWFYTDDWKFAAASNGCVFRDDLGAFSKIRGMLLSYYPECIRLMRLTNALHNFSAAMQANYARCMSRHDIVAASYCKIKSIDAAMDIIFLLKKRFAPYYKWKFKAFKELPGTELLSDLIEQAANMSPDFSDWENKIYDPYNINLDDDLIRIFEQIAALIVEELNREDMINSDDPFLEAHCAALAQKLNTGNC